VTAPPLVRCPHCRRTDIRVTADGYLYSHQSGRVRCNGSGMAASLLPPERITMTTITTHVASIADLLDLSAYAGDFADDFDWAAVDAEVVDALNAETPDGVTVTASGEVYAELPVADEAREIDWRSLIDSVDLDTILQRHDLRAPKA
jgi:hypothetical protein